MTALAWYGLRGPAKLAAMADRLHAACLNILATPNGNVRLKAPVAPPAPYPAGAWGGQGQRGRPPDQPGPRSERNSRVIFTPCLGHAVL